MTPREQSLEYEKKQLIAILKGLLLEQPKARKDALNYLVEVFEEDGLEHLM